MSKFNMTEALKGIEQPWDGWWAAGGGCRTRHGGWRAGWANPHLSPAQARPPLWLTEDRDFLFKDRPA